MKQNLAVGTMLALLGVLGSSDAGAHTAPSVCWEELESTFAHGNLYAQARTGFVTWMTLSAAGKNVSCTTPQTPGTPHSSCWMWRRRCGAHYINLEPNANEGHLNYTNITPPFSFCDPGDGLGLGFAKRTAPPCPNWAAEPVSTITPHGPSYSLTLWVENRIGGNPVLFDFNYISVASAAMKLSVKDAAGTWWVIAASLAPNTPGTYYDITNQGWEITQAVMTNANPGELTAVAGLYYLTPN